MVIENAYALEEIKLGRRGENQARKVVFNVLEKWREGYGEGVASLIVQRNGDAQPYPVTVTEEDGALVWRVSSVDTAVAGEGAAELRYTVGDTIVKSQIYKTRVRETLEDSGETPPPAYQSWVDEVLQAAADAQTAATNAAKSETAAKNAQTAAANAQKAAESAQTGAQTAKTAAESAQEAAENAKDAAAGSSTAAGQKATQAAQSAEDAASAKSAAETAKTDAQAARDAIANMIVEAVTLETGEPATVSKSLVDNVYKLVFGLPRGNTGATGPHGATGNGISGIALKSGNHAPGTSDVYTITLTDGTTFDFEVYNGANGQGAGDMLTSVYDPRGKRTDVYKYVDDAIGKIPTPDVSAQIKAHNESETAHPDIRKAVNDKLDKPANNTTATIGQLLTKTADGQEWKDREKDVFVVNMTTSNWSTIEHADKTFEEIQAAYIAGKAVIARLYFGPLSKSFDCRMTSFARDSSIGFEVLSGSQSLEIKVQPENIALSWFAAQSQINAKGILKGNGSGGIVAATRGSDYIASGNIIKQTLVNVETTPTENYAINWVFK